MLLLHKKRAHTLATHSLIHNTENHPRTHSLATHSLIYKTENHPRAHSPLLVRAAQSCWGKHAVGLVTRGFQLGHGNGPCPRLAQFSTRKCSPARARVAALLEPQCGRFAMPVFLHAAGRVGVVLAPANHFCSGKAMLRPAGARATRPSSGKHYLCGSTRAHKHS